MKNIEYERKIAGFDRNKLIELWKAVETGDTPGWEPGKAFEYLVLRAFELEGAEVRWPYNVGKLEQIDGVIYSDGLAFLVECKDGEGDPINIEPIAKLRNQLLRRPSATLGIVFSRSGFTDSAVVLTQYIAPQTILLWNGPEIGFALETARMRQGLLAKYRHCIERGVADYDILQLSG